MKEFDKDVEGLEVDGKRLNFKEGGFGPYDPTPANMIALSQAKSLKRIADVLERTERKLVRSDTAKAFFRKIVAFVMAAPVPPSE